MNQDFKNKIQEVYDSLIGYSNTAFKNSKEDLPPITKHEYYAKSEAYENAARLLDASLATKGIYIVSTETERAFHKMIEEERRAEYNEQQRQEDAEAQLDEIEMVYHEA